MDLKPNVCSEVNIVLESELPTVEDALAFELRNSAVLTLLSLLEGNTKKHHLLLMISTLSFPVLGRTLDEMWRMEEVLLLHPGPLPCPQPVAHGGAEGVRGRAVMQGSRNTPRPIRERIESHPKFPPSPSRKSTWTRGVRKKHSP